MTAGMLAMILAMGMTGVQMQTRKRRAQRRKNRFQSLMKKKNRKCQIMKQM